MLIKIYKFFGFMSQLGKAWEEYDETGTALRQFTRHHCKENIIDALNETNDLLNVLEGIAVVEYGVCLDEIAATKKSKKLRTVKIINRIDKNLDYKGRIKEYERLRRI